MAVIHREACTDLPPLPPLRRRHHVVRDANPAWRDIVGTAPGVSPFNGCFDSLAGPHYVLPAVPNVVQLPVAERRPL